MPNTQKDRSSERCFKMKKGEIVLLDGRVGRIVSKRKEKYGFETDTPEGRIIEITKGKQYYEVAIPAKTKYPKWIYSVRAKDLEKVV